MPQNQTLEIVAHSQGAAITSTALAKLSPEERARIDLVSVAGAAWTYPNDLHSFKAFLNTRDLVAMGPGLGLPGFPLENFARTRSGADVRFGVTPFDGDTWQIVNWDLTHSIDSYSRLDFSAQGPLEAEFNEATRFLLPLRAALARVLSLSP